MIADTSGLLALFNSSEPHHEAISALVAALDTPLVVSPFVIAELDYLVATRLGQAAASAVLTELAGGAYDLPGLDAADLARCNEVVVQYADANVGITDASLVVLAERYDTTNILTLDRRHFTVLTPISGKHFTLPSL